MKRTVRFRLGTKKKLFKKQWGIFGKKTLKALKKEEPRWRRKAEEQERRNWDRGGGLCQGPPLNTLD